MRAAASPGARDRGRRVLVLVALATVAAVLALVAWLLPDRTEISVPVAPGSAASLSTTLPTLPRP